MAQFTDRQSVIDWINAHKNQRVRLQSERSTLRVVGVTRGVEELDACSTEIPYAELRTGIAGLHVALSLHDEALSLHVLAAAPEGGPAPLSLPLGIPYADLRMAPADAPERKEAAAEEPEFSPYELLHRPRPD